MPRATTVHWNGALQIHLLGELQLRRAGKPAALPASRKTRALLAYLASNTKRHLRTELCGLFWEDASDPRAALRWSLTQIRRALGERDRSIVCADRDSVQLRGASVVTDRAHFAALTRDGVGNSPREALLEAGALFRGEFLDGLDLPGCYAYHEWCLAERETASREHERVLAALVSAFSGDPQQALVHARALVAHNPFDENGHVELIRILGALGRKADALAQYRQCCRIFERELGLGPPALLEAARAGLDAAGATRNRGAPPGEAARGDVATGLRPRAGLVGRDAETALLARSVADACAGSNLNVLLIGGVPGIGKSRLLDEVVRQLDACGGQSLRGHAFEAETLRPFGFWIDLLRSVRADGLPEPVRRALSPLIQGGAGAAAGSSRDRLFDAVLATLAHLANSKPLAVLVDDLQWIEESSAALLHYAMRRPETKAVLFVLAARAGELEDNTAAQKMIASLAHARRLRRVTLEPLSEADAQALVRSVAPDLEPGAIVARSAGNPLFLIELSRERNAAPAAPGVLDAILDTRLSRITRDAAELMHWACAFGRSFPLDALIEACCVDDASAARSLSELERHDLIAAAQDGYAFAHDLIHEAAYARIPQPRRRMMHKSIARLMSREMLARPDTCGEVAHHAALGEQYELAARATVCAGDHALRILAKREAAEFARRGLRLSARVALPAERVRPDIALLRILVLAASGPELARLRPDAEVIASAIARARELQLFDEVSQGYYLLSVVHHEAGDLDSAQHATLQAATASEAAEGHTRARQLANTARCLVELGREVPRARELVSQARALAESAGVEDVEMRWCAGLLHNWDGDLDSAVAEIEAATALASRAQDRWRECRCLGWLATIELERRRPRQAIARARQLKLAASQLGEGGGEPLALAIEALALRMQGKDAPHLDDAIAELRSADDKSRLAYVLNLAASIRLERGEPEDAAAIAADALAMAEAIGERNESALAHAAIAQAAAALGDRERARDELETLRPVLDAPGTYSARAVDGARSAVRALQRLLNVAQV